MRVFSPRIKRRALTDGWDGIFVKQVTIYSDGACQGNPGPGGWGAILIYGSQVKRISGGEPATTNNRMEVQAALSALMALKEPCAIEFYTDSEYLREGITTWIKGWKMRGWMTRDKKPVKNEHLWRALDDVAAKHQIRWNWVKGHSGDRYNEECDALAVRAIEQIRKQFDAASLKQKLIAFREQAAAETTPALFRE